MSWARVALAMALAAGVVLWWRSGVRPNDSPAVRATAPPRPRAEQPPSPERATSGVARDTPTAPDPLADLRDPGELWSAVDMEALRKELPDNLYWRMAAPTTDPEILREREEERDRWNVEYGKVLSNTATADEVDTYYAHRHRLSSDYVQLVTYLLADHGDHLPARDVGLLKLAVELHLARLEEIPRQVAEAHERRIAHDAARRAWLEDQKAFDGEDFR